MFPGRATPPRQSVVRLPRRASGLLLPMLVLLGTVISQAHADPVAAAPSSGSVQVAAPVRTDPVSPGSDPGSDTGGSGQQSDDATPLTLRLQSLSPAVVPVQGPLLMTGSVRNDSEETWEDVNVAPFVGDTPLTTRAELDLAAQTPEETEVGARLSEPGTFVSVGDLEPGEAAEFAVSVPREFLPPDSAPGAYWIGVHALGTDAEGRDSVADGRARTFVALPPRGGSGAGQPDQPGQPSQLAQVPVSLVLPVQAEALRDGDGRLADLDSWVDIVSDDGRLDRISRLAEAAGARPLGWLVDPAVLDALDDLGRGDPPLSLGPRDTAQPSQPTASAAPTDPDATGPAGEDATPDDGTPEDQPADDTPDDQSADDSDDSDAPGAAAARAVAQRLAARLATDRLLVTPYADTDTTALVRRAPGLLARALTLTEQALQQRGLTGQTVLASPAGRADPDLLGRLPDQVGLVLSDRGDTSLPVSGTLDGRPVLLADAAAGTGGPGPTPRLDALALRQRLLVETSLESQEAVAAGRDPRAVVVVLPRDWDPGPDWEAADLFGALEVPWLRWATPPAASDPLDLALDYPDTLRRREVGQESVAAARDLVAAGAALEGLLTNDNTVGDQLTGAALQGVSYAARARREESAAAVDALTATVRRDTGRVGVFGSEFVTLSGGSGTLTVTVVNDLAQPVEVAVDVRADAGVRVEGIAPVALGPQQRVTVRVPVVSDTGVHDVTLVPVTTAGVPAGSTFDFVLRTSQVGRTIWVVMAAAGLLFAVTLLRRLRQRWREGVRVRTRASKLREEQ